MYTELDILRKEYRSELEEKKRLLTCLEQESALHKAQINTILELLCDVEDNLYDLKQLIAQAEREDSL